MPSPSSRPAPAMVSLFSVILVCGFGGPFIFTHFPLTSQSHSLYIQPLKGLYTSHRDVFYATRKSSRTRSKEYDAGRSLKGGESHGSEEGWSAGMWPDGRRDRPGVCCRRVRGACG